MFFLFGLWIFRVLRIFLQFLQRLVLGFGLMIGCQMLCLLSCVLVLLLLLLLHGVRLVDLLCDLLHLLLQLFLVRLLRNCNLYCSYRIMVLLVLILLVQSCYLRGLGLWFRFSHLYSKRLCLGLCLVCYYLDSGRFCCRMGLCGLLVLCFLCFYTADLVYCIYVLLDVCFLC